jgi:flagellin
MANEVVLSTGVRANLLSLQQTTDLITTTQTRLATGKRVNSALDNATNFFMANSFQTSVTNLNTLLDQMNLAQRTLDLANNGITQITNLLGTAKGTLSQALAAPPTTAVITGTSTAVAGVTITATTTLASIGFAATDVITVSDGTGNTVVFTTTATQTVQSLINAINAGGASGNSRARAEIGGDGRLLLEAAGATYSLSISTNSGSNGAALSNLGFNSNTNNGTLNNSAASTGVTNSTRTALAAQFNALRTQIDQLAIDSGYNGVQLLNSGSLTVFTNETSTAKVILTGLNATATGLGLTSTFTANTFQANADVNAAIVQTKASLVILQNQASTYASQVSILETRAQFTKETTNNLTTGINDLTLADSNQVGAQLLALQTRQSLSSTALSLATQADQNVLRLFR